MNIAKAAKATRRFYITQIIKPDGAWMVIDRTTGDPVAGFSTDEEAGIDACNKSLIAVLEAIREPSQRMSDAAPSGDLKTAHGAVYVWRAMIDALIEECRR